MHTGGDGRTARIARLAQAAMRREDLASDTNAHRRAQAHQERAAGLPQADHTAGGVQGALQALRHQPDRLLQPRPAVPRACAAQSGN